MHIYVFGSICRGDIDADSDVDLLAIVEGEDRRFNPDVYSIYSYSRISELWRQGNPFAWHLFLESKLVFSSDNENFIEKLGMPSAYTNAANDCDKFYRIFLRARDSIKKSNLCEVFDLSTIFLSIRNFATCYSLGFSDKPDFSRNSALNLGSKSIDISEEQYRLFEKARILSTRGTGDRISDEDIHLAVGCTDVINDWMDTLLNLPEINTHE